MCYVIFFAFSLQTIHEIVGDTVFPNPFFGIAFFLTVFVFSALLCATVALGYPTLLCLEKNYRRATQVVLWSIAWLAILLLTVGLIVIATVSMR
jgi:hypothetical protein